MKQIEGLI